MRLLLLLAVASVACHDLPPGVGDECAVQADCPDELLCIADAYVAVETVEPQCVLPCDNDGDCRDVGCECEEDGYCSTACK